MRLKWVRTRVGCDIFVPSLELGRLKDNRIIGLKKRVQLCNSEESNFLKSSLLKGSSVFSREYSNLFGELSSRSIKVLK